jgi:hypothetical protein
MRLLIECAGATAVPERAGARDGGALVLHWAEALELLAAAGSPLPLFEDLSSAAELRLGELVSERSGADFFMLDQYPSAVRSVLRLFVDHMLSVCVCAAHVKCHLNALFQTNNMSSAFKRSCMNA